MKDIFLKICKVLREQEEKKTQDQIDVENIKKESEKIRVIAQLIRSKNELKRAKIEKEKIEKEEQERNEKENTVYPSEEEQQAVRQKNEETQQNHTLF